MTDPEFAVVLFHTSNHAFRAERVLGKEGIACKLVPVPRHLSSDCGVCAQIRREHQQDTARILQAARVEVAGIHGG